MTNSNPWDIHSSLHRNPSTATGASVFSSDYYHPQRYDSRRSIGSTVGPPPLSPRPGLTGTSASATTSPVTGPSHSANNLFQSFRNSTGSPWPVPSAPSSPAPAPPPAVQSLSGSGSGSGSSFQRPRPGMNTHNPSMSSSSSSQSASQHSQSQSQSQSRGLSPLNIPELGSGRISPASHPATPVQRPGSHLSHNSRGYSRAGMEHEFTIKHAQLVDQAKLLLAEMTALQVLGPIHGVATHSGDDHGGDDASTSSFFSGSGSGSGTTTNANNTALFYEQDEASMAALSAILQGKLGSLVSKPPPRPARAVAREVLSKFGTAASPLSGSGITTADEEAEAEAIELLMEDYEAVLGWARTASSSQTQRPISSAASSSSSQGQNTAQQRVKSCLDERQTLLEAALPAWLGHLPSEAMMHFGHERLYLSSNSNGTTNLSRGTSVHSGVSGTRNGNGYTNGNGNLAVNGTSRVSNIPTQTYSNTTTFNKNLPIEEIPRRRFLKTDDNYAWDMLELATALENDLSMTNTSRGVRGANVPPALRNPVTRAFFTPEDVNKILAHPMGRSLGPYPTSRRRSVSPEAVRPVSPLPLPESVSALERNLNREDADGLRVASGGSGSGSGSFRPRLYGHDEGVEPDDSRRGFLGLDQTDENDNGNGGMDIPWSAPPPPYNATSDTPATTDTSIIPRSPTSPPPPPPPLVPTVNRPNSPSYTTAPTPLRPYSPPSSPPPLLANTTGSQAPEPGRSISPRIQVQPPVPRPLPGSYPTWEEREQDNDDRFNPDFVSTSRHELLSAPPPASVPSLNASASSPNLTSPSSGNNNNDRGSNARSPVFGRPTSATTDSASLIQQIASGLASIPIPTTAAPPTSLTSNRSNVGSQYRSSLLGNLNPQQPSSNTSSPTSPSYPPPLIPRPLSTSTSTVTGTSRPPWLPPPTSAPATAPAPISPPTNNNNNEESSSKGTSWEARERERERERQQEPGRGRWETTLANNNRNSSNYNYLSSSYGVATPPPSGPIPVSSLTSLNAAANTSTSSTSAGDNGPSTGYRTSGYFSLGASHRNISLGESQSESQSQSQQYQPVQEQERQNTDGIQRGRWESREYASLNSNTYGRSPPNNNDINNNPFSSSRDPSATREGVATNRDEWWAANGRGPVGRVAEMDAGPFELADTPPRLPELGGGTIRRRRDDNDNDDDDAHSREWMGEFASRR
ncbi:hypothetical protein V8F20_002783 [Naviculisporaceae sp. PSN 640]